MNRPRKLTDGDITKARQWMNTHNFIRWMIYEYEELDKYCDELESDYRVLQAEYQADQQYIADWDTTKEWYWKKIKRLEKALDKACALLTYDQFNAIPPKELLNLCMKNWKERLLNDE